MFSVYPLITKPIPSFIALGLIVSGIPIFFFLVRSTPQSNFLDRYAKVVTTFIQKTTMCVPEELENAGSRTNEKGGIENRAFDSGTKSGTENAAFKE